MAKTSTRTRKRRTNPPSVSEISGAVEVQTAERAGVAETNGGSVAANGSGPASQEIRRRAYELFLARGAVHGHDVADWLRAERELRQGL